MLPVLILGIVAVVSNILALSNTKKVHTNASNITEHYMVSVTKLSTIKEQTQELHNLGLSHIIATDSTSMIHYIDTIKEKELVLQESIENYKQYLNSENESAYKDLGKQLSTLTESLKRVCAYSANTQTALANTIANEEVAVEVDSMLTDLGSMETNLQTTTENARNHLAEVYNSSLIINMIAITISVLAILCAIYIVSMFVVRPITKAEKELSEIIDGIDKGEAGKGFAVVANEISQLAEESRQSANNIQRINVVVTKAVHNLAEHAENLVSYMKSSILPEFQNFVTVGNEYKENATDMERIHKQMDENKGIALQLKKETSIFKQL